MRNLRAVICQYALTIALIVVGSGSWAGEKRDIGAPLSLDPRLDITNAINLALERARKERADEVKEFFVRMAEFDAMSRRWNVVFQGREARLEFESCFRIFVDDTTRATEYRACPG